MLHSITKLKAASSSCLVMQCLDRLHKGLPTLEMLTQPLALLPGVLAGQHLALLPWSLSSHAFVGMRHQDLVSY